ncbi:MAG TPA: hypothetical protein VE994_06100 [Terriglobales bacterium]|nr:hypothetical protein [Terriglobales bacterium]
MKKILLTGFMLLLSAGWMVAQSSDQSSSSAQSSNGQATSSAQSGTAGSSATSQTGNTAGQAPDTTGNSTTADTSKSTKDNKSDELRGCITQVNGDYMFTTVHGRRFVLQGDQHLIGNHLGQAVEINGGVWHKTGTTGSTDPLEATDGTASSRSLTVKTITPIEGKCTPDYH